MPPNPDELKTRTKQLLRFACHQKHLHRGDKTSKQSVQSGLLYLGVSDEYSSSRLCLSPAFWFCRLLLSTHESLRVLTVLSCSPQIFSTSSSLHPLLFSLQCLSLQCYRSSASLVCVLSRLASPLPFSVPTPRAGRFFAFQFFFVWDYSVNVCQERRADFFFGGGGRTQLCILMSWAVATAVWGRLVLVVCCVIQRCSCLFLITYLKVPVGAAGVLVEKNKTCMQFSRAGGKECECVCYGLPSTYCSPIAPNWRGKRSRILALILLRAKAGRVGMSLLIPSSW